MISFDEFFEELWGYGPFPWQSRLAKQVVKEREWPKTLDLPTSAGKTATIDIAVYALAAEAASHAEVTPKGKAAKKQKPSRTAALRTFFVIDRRIVVNEAFDRACKIALMLEKALAKKQHRLHEIAAALMSFGGKKPLHAARLRGGIYRDDEWTHSPNQPTIAVSTVDQVGSRLLFRGYGVSRYSQSIHAGLVGMDCLYLIDEAHMSRPFLETLHSVSNYHATTWCDQPLPLPFGVVELSATPVDPAEPFRIDDKDRRHPVFAMRLDSHKRAELVKENCSHEDEEKNREHFAQAVASQALTLLQPAAQAATPRRGRRRTEADAPVNVPQSLVIGVVVNRVATARRVFEILRAGSEAGARPGSPEIQSILLTGRIRSFDREQLLDPQGFLRYIKADKDRPSPPQPIVVVATQTVEVGADLSFDALVTEIAPLDSLRQRFGRLDRLGLRRESRAVVIARKDSVARSADDAIYGKTLAPTWQELETKARANRGLVDFGISAFEPPSDPTRLRSMCAARESAPVLLPSHLDLLTQTSQAPYPDPDPSLFLHGTVQNADVQLVWRGDLPNSISVATAELCVAIVSLAPPTSMEALAVPIYAVRAWLNGLASSEDVTDLEGIAGEDTDDTESARCVLRWLGPDDSEVVTPEGIRPGDTLIVPSSWGGTDLFGWHPPHLASVRDVGDPAAYSAKRRAQLRFHPKVIHDWFAEDNRPGWLTDIELMLTCTDGEPDNQVEAVLLALVDRVKGLPETHWLRVVAEFLSKNSPRFERYPEVANQPSAAFRVTSKRAIDPSPSQVKKLFESSRDEVNTDEVTSDDDSSNLIETGGVLLRDHCAAVEKRVRTFFECVGLEGNAASSTAVAAGFHDAGKADDRFQAWLHGGDAWMAATSELLAKSLRSPRSPDANRRARELAGYPEGGRHEILSVLMLQECPGVLDIAGDPKLALWLVGTHHGRGRPFFDVFEVPDELQVECTLGAVKLVSTDAGRKALVPLQRIDAGWVDLFRELETKYGWWGLAYLEMMLRLGDHRQSEDERQRNT